MREVRLSKPRDLAKAFAQEVDLLHYIVELWWANRAVHEHTDQINVSETFSVMRRRARDASNTWEYATALREGLWTLGDGHLRLGQTYRSVERAFTSGLAFVPVQEGVALTWADNLYLSNAPIGPESGDLLNEIDGQPSEVFLESVRLMPGSTSAHRRWNAILSLSWQERLPHEHPTPAEVTLQKINGQRYSFPIRWMPASVNAPTRDAVRGSMLEDGIGYLEIRTFYCRDELGQVSDREFSRQINEAAAKLQGAEYLVVDLRRNGGGRDQQAQIAASLFTREPIEWFRVRHPEPYKDVHQLPPEPTFMDPTAWALPHFISSHLWFLIGPGCFSTSEIFASAFRHKGYVIFIGETTAGGAGNPQDFRLPYSGLTVTIPVSEYYMAGSNVARIEGNGVVPDLPAVQSAADLRAGRDTAREQAIIAIEKRSGDNPFTASR